MPRKSAVSTAAAVLGRRGGQSTSPAKARAVRENGRHTRFQPRYRLTPAGELERLTDGHWTLLREPYDAAAKRWLWRQRTGRYRTRGVRHPPGSSST